MRIESFIGLRFLRSPRQAVSVSVVTWISAVGVMLGVTALIITISVMNGFRDNLFHAVTGTMAHARLEPVGDDVESLPPAALRERLEQRADVEATAPYLALQGFLRSQGAFRAVLVRGIDPAQEARVSELGRFLQGPRAEEGLGADSTVAGTSASGAETGAETSGAEVLQRLAYPPPPGKRAGIVLGSSLAAALRLHLGDAVEVVSTAQRITPIGPVPLIKRFTVVGVYETGLANMDEVLVYVDGAIARKLYRLAPDAGGISVRVTDPHAIDTAGLGAAAPGYRLRTWADENRNIFQVMRLEKVGVFLILTLIIVVGFFNIIASLIMLVLEKRKAIAVLMSLGASAQLVRRIFFMQGVWIGTVGTLAGLSLGLLGCWLLATFDLIPLPEGVFPITKRLPVQVELADIALITGCSFLICLVVTLYPATSAARTRPIENLRNE